MVRLGGWFLAHGALLGLELQLTLPSPSRPDGKWRVSIAGSCSFFALPRLNRVLHSIPEGTDVLVELSADYVDHAFHEALVAWKKQHTAAGGSVLIEEHGNTAFQDAAANTPQRQEALELPLQPRANRQPAGIDDVEHLRLRSILLGVDKYHRRHADKVLPLIQDLAEGQNPDTLFVACVDSRVNPNLITSSGPGDLLTLRNIGNVVSNAGEDASIESVLSFALTGLGVESIVICGHSNCGAMKAVIADAETGPASLGLGEAFNTWLGHARPSHQELLDGHPVAAAAAAAGYSRLDQLGMVNVAVQLRKLEDHPLAGPALATGQLQATGLFFDITTARVILITTDSIQHLDAGAAPLSRAVSP
ncbi:carbonic anhydrase [Arthrobacter sp. QXT-31]|uniref:carbonic anhydrase n=1 Tax=Arthrobacter sp. QXT-31 TaxID=1357915 RepID=UPI001F3518BA|nr:carbonic anhydrase [Arthrobacter sp. QXT-31]